MPILCESTDRSNPPVLKASCGLILDALTGVCIAECRDERDAREIVERFNVMPELLEALKGLLKVVPYSFYSDQLDIASKAIAKAEGRA